MKLNNFRMAGYTLIAMSLINMVYRSGGSNTTGKSLFGIAAGALLLLLTFIAKSSGYFEKKLTAYFWAAIFLIAVTLLII